MSASEQLGECGGLNLRAVMPDTNVYVRFFDGNPEAALCLGKIFQENLELHLAGQAVLEIWSVLRKRKQIKIKDRRIKAFIDQLREFSVKECDVKRREFNEAWVVPCEHEGDARILRSAWRRRVSTIISSDPHLYRMNPFWGMKIVHPYIFVRSNRDSGLLPLLQQEGYGNSVQADSGSTGQSAAVVAGP